MIVLQVSPYVILSIGAMPPHKVALKEHSQESIDEPIEIAKPNVPIYGDTLCFPNVHSVLLTRWQRFPRAGSTTHSRKRSF